MTTHSPDWFEVHDGSDLEQGDLLLQCPRFTVVGLTTWPPPPDPEIAVEVDYADCVVVTQSCDLQNKDLDHVLLARVRAWSDVVAQGVARGKTHVKSTAFREALVQGNVPGASLLHRFDGLVVLPWAVADFHDLWTLPKPVIEEFARLSGARLRLRPPYKEHLAQAFARYFMRVGLPHDAKAFVKEGKVDI